jgi:hypothetical protein
VHVLCCSRTADICGWPDAPQVEYLLCYAAAGSSVQFCALKRNDGHQVYKLGEACNLKTVRGTLALVQRTLLVTSIICLQRLQLVRIFTPLGTSIERPNGTTVAFFDGFITKKVNLAVVPMSDERIKDLQDLYSATQHSPYVVHARKAPFKRPSPPSYEVDLVPLGRALCAAPPEQDDCRAAVRYFPSAALGASRSSFLAFDYSGLRRGWHRYCVLLSCSVHCTSYDCQSALLY